MSDSYLSIEPSVGETYSHPGEWTVYRYSTWPEDSVLAGRQRRRYVEGEFTSPEAARAKYPAAEQGGHFEPSLHGEPPPGFFPDDE